MAITFNAEQDSQAINALGNNIAQTIMLNTRAKLAQAQIARQQANDLQQRLYRQAQTDKANQEVIDLLAQQQRIKQAGTVIAKDFGNEELAPIGEVIARSPAAMVSFTQGIKTNPGQQVDRPFAPRIVNTQPRVLGLNQQLVPNEEGQSGYVGSSAAGVYKPGETKPIVPPAPHYGTAQGDVESMRAEQKAMSISAKELEMLAETDPEQFAYNVQMRKRARERALQGGQGVMPSTNSVLTTNAPLQIKSIKLISP